MCPAVKKYDIKNRHATHTEISTSDGLTGVMKSGKGTKTGVNLQYHPKPEYDLLSPAKNKELANWKKSNGRTFDPQPHREICNGKCFHTGNDKRSSKLHKKWEGKIYSLIASNNEKFEAMSTLLNTNYAALASIQSHLDSATADVEILPTKSPITTLQGAQAASLKLQGILNNKCGNG